MRKKGKEDRERRQREWKKIEKEEKKREKEERKREKGGSKEMEEWRKKAGRLLDTFKHSQGVEWEQEQA